MDKNVIPIASLKTEDGMNELLKSENMQPYLRFYTAQLQGRDVQRHLDEIARLPLQDRYLWRICSALKWGFGDFDRSTVTLDANALNKADAQAIVHMLELRPIQFCMLMRTLFGPDEMENLMLGAIKKAKE
jgi:hypothetical protein